MKSVEPRQLIEGLNWRYAVQLFDVKRKIDPETWETIERALVLTPSSYGLQPWKFVVVEDRVKREALRRASWGQAQLTDASHVVVFARKREVLAADVERHIERVLQVRGGEASTLSEYRDSMLRSMERPASLPGGSMDAYTRSQTYIAMGLFLATCALLGVDTCPMEGFDPSAYDRILGLEGGEYTSTVVGTAGYRDARDETANWAKVRFDPSELVERR